MAEKLKILKLTPQEPYNRPSKRITIVSNIQYPSRQRQIERLDRSVRQLYDEIQAQTARFQEGTQGIDPEFVLVFEVIGSVSSFMAAAKAVGMDWIGEYDDEAVESNDDFFELNNRGEIKQGAILPQRMYLTLSNQHSMNRMLSLWDQYQRGVEFERGTTGFRDVFNHLSFPEYG